MTATRPDPTRSVRPGADTIRPGTVRTATAAGVTVADDPTADVAVRFGAHSAAAPDRPALTAGRETVTFGELRERADRLAGWLRAQDIGPEDLVGICLPRTFDLVVAVLAVLRTGAGYVPMDPALPRARREFMRTDSGARTVLTERVLQDHATDIAARPATAPEGGWPAGRVAYVIYTSGSTGTPKGVAVQNDQLSAYLAWAVPTYFTGDGGAPLHSPVNYDLSITSLLAPLVAGRPVALLPVEDPPVTALPAALTSSQFDIAKVTPAHLGLLCDIVAPDALPGLPTLVVGGEALTYEHLAPLRDHAPDVVVWNEYGPTETVVGCCVAAVRAGEPGSGAVPIGRATPGTRLLVLDDDLEAVLPGGLGELFIAGDQVSRGYLGRPGLTAARFLPEPGGDGGRMYRTGDLVVANDAGVLTYAGRRDDQVKVHGHRIELGEVENALARHPGVAAAAVVAAGSGAARRLVGFHVPAPGAAPDASTLTAHLSDLLPRHMVPDDLRLVDDLPLAASGKVDRGRLTRLAEQAPEPEASPEPTPAAATASSEPADSSKGAATADNGETAPFESDVRGVFAEVLGRPVDARDATFVELGGTSLQISRVIGLLTSRLDLDLPPDALLRSPTVEGIAATIERYHRLGAAAVADPGHDVVLDISLDDDILGELGKESTHV